MTVQSTPIGVGIGRICTLSVKDSVRVDLLNDTKFPYGGKGFQLGPARPRNWLGDAPVARWNMALKAETLS